MVNSGLAGRIKAKALVQDIDIIVISDCHVALDVYRFVQDFREWFLIPLAGFENSTLCNVINQTLAKVN